MRVLRSPDFIHPLQRMFGPAALVRREAMQRFCDEYGRPKDWVGRSFYGSEPQIIEFTQAGDPLKW